MIFKSSNFFLICCFILAIVYPRTSISAPVYSFKKIQIPELTGVNSFHWMYQDKSGFIWIATDIALYRFDGYDLKTFSHDPENKRSLLNTQNYVIFEDGEDNLWFGGGYGLSRYIPKEQGFKRYIHDSEDPKTLPKGTLLTHLVDSEGRFWVSTHEGLAIYSPETDDFVRVVPFKLSLEEAGSLTSISRINVMGMHEISPNKFLLTTYSNGVYVYNHSAQTIKHEPIFSAGKEIKKFRSSYYLEGGTYLLSTAEGIIKFNLSLWKAEPFFKQSFRSEIVKSGYPVIFQEDKSDGIYIADGGLHYYLDGTLATYFRASDLNIKNPSAQNLVSSILVTKEQGLLVAVDGVGLFSAHRSTSAVPLATSQNSPAKVSDSNPRKIAEDYQARLWVAEGKSVKVVRETPLLNRMDIVANIPIVDVHSIMFTDNNNQYLATPDSVYHINPDFSYRKILSAEDRGIDELIKVDWLNDEELIIISHKGIYRFNVRSDIIIDINAPEFDSIALEIYRHKNVAVSPDREQFFMSFWRDGYLVYDLSAKKVVELRLASDDNYPLPDSDIPSLTDSQEGMLWLDIVENKYGLFNWNTRKIRLMNAEIGPVACIAGSIGRHFVQQSGGALQLYENNVLTKTFGIESGIMSGVLNSDTCFISSSNRLYLGGSDGLRVFNNPIQNENQPQVMITDFLIADSVESGSNNPLIKTERNTLSHVEIPHHRNIFTFQFSSSSIAQAEANRFRYKLIGLNDNWHYTTSARRSATYTNLSAGDYTFIVEASNNSGLFSEAKKVAVTVNVNPLLSWWAITFYIALFASIIVGWISVLKLTVSRQTKQIQTYNLDLKIKNDELLNLTEKIQKLLEVKDNLIKHISHEFKTPLTVLVGYLVEIETALNINSKTVNGQNTGDLVVRQIKSIDRLVSQLMDLSKLEGSTDIELTPLDISEQLRKIVPMFDGYASQFEVDVSVSIQNNLIIDVDQESIERVISNLISNAIKYNRRKGKVDITALRVDAEVIISFRDNGIGIAEDDRKVIFKRFSKVDNKGVLDHPVDSSGLGLAIVKEGVEANCGTIELNSEVGSGSEFIIRFPVSQSKLVENSQLDESQPALKESVDNRISETKLVLNKVIDNAKKTVLLVEDSDDIAQLLTNGLSINYNVLRAEHGVEGLELAKTNLPDVIISDVMMPYMDGFEFAEAIHNDVITGHIPLLFLSAIASKEAYIAGLNLGAVDFIKKPFNLSVVQLKVQNLIENNRRQAERFAKISTLVKKDVRMKVSQDPQFIEKLDAYIEKYLGEKITVENLAASLFMDRSALTRKVKTMTTLSTQQYILRYRLAKAYELLPNATLVGEIASQLGFSTPNHLSSAFSKQFGITCRDRMANKVSDKQPEIKN